MKKILLSIASMTLLAGCAAPYEHNLTIITPTGAPSLAFYNYVKDANFETNNDASNIVPMMVKGQKDIVVLPTNVGVNAIVNKKVDYKIAATITFGNLFVASTGNDDNDQLDKDDYIVLFQQGSVPDLVFHGVFGKEYDDSIHYVSNAKAASQCLMTGKNIESENEPVDYVLIAEPAFTTVKGKNEKVKEYANIQTLYKEKFNSEIFQASVFVKSGVDATSFLSSLEGDIKTALNNGDVLAEKLAQADNAEAVFGVNPQVAANVTKNGNGMGLGFKLAKDNKEGIDKFLKVFNIDATSEEIYYK